MLSEESFSALLLASVMVGAMNSWSDLVVGIIDDEASQEALEDHESP